MKQVTINRIITMMLAVWMISSCQKETETGRDIPGSNKAQLTENPTATTGAEAITANTTTAVGATGTIKPPCSVCDVSTRSYDLLADLRTSRFTEGSNVVRDLGNGLKVVAQVKRGQISQWVLQDRTGKQYLAKSAERKGQTSYRPGGGWGAIWVICYFTPWGWYCIWVVF